MTADKSSGSLGFNVSFLPLLLLALSLLANRVSAFHEIPSPWYIQNARNFEVSDPKLHIIQTVKHDNGYYIFTGVNNSDVIQIYDSTSLSPSVAANVTTQAVSVINNAISSVGSISLQVTSNFFLNASVGIPANSSGIRFFRNLTVQNWKFDPERRWSSISFSVKPAFGDIYVAAFSNVTGLRIQGHDNSTWENLALENYSIPDAPTIENPYVVTDWKEGAIVVGIYQHEFPKFTNRSFWYIGVYGHVYNLTSQKWDIFLAKYNRSEPYFLHSMALDCSKSENAADYLIKLVNDTRITYLHPNSNATSFLTNSSTDLSSGVLSDLEFALYEYDKNTKISYYLFHRSNTNYEVWLRSFDNSDNYLRDTILPVNVSTTSRFQMDIKVWNGSVYTVIAADASLMDCSHGCNTVGKTDIYLFQFNSTDLKLKSKLVLSTSGDDIISKLDVDNTTGALQLMWISNNVLNSTLYNFRLAPFEISHVSVVNANLSRIRENNTIRIEFSVPPAELQLVDLSYVPVVYVRDKPSPLVRWNNNKLDVSVPRGAGIGLGIRVEFPYLPNKPTIEVSTNFSYAPPLITSIEPRAVPAAGGTRLKVRVENIGDVGDIQALVGTNNATCVDIVLEDGGFSCSAPPGTAKDMAQILVEAGNQPSNLNWITYYEPIYSIPVTIEENLVQSNVPLVTCPDYLGSSDQLEYRIVEVPEVNVGTFFGGNSSTPIMQGKDVFVSDINGSVSYLPSENYHGIFAFRYYCQDKSGGSKTNPIAVEISVLPHLSCQSEALISDIVTLTERNLSRDRLWLKISHGPKNGSILSVKSANFLLIKPEELFQEETVRYFANYSVERRTSLPVDKITYYAVNDMNMMSKSCTLQFSISCAPLFLNVFNKSLPRVCASCPNNAVCSPNGDQAPVPNRGHWKSKDDVFLPCASQKACPANGNGECALGYTGIRCGDCSMGYYKLNKECFACRGDPAITLLIIFGVLVGGAIVVSVIIRFAENGPSLGFATIFVNFIQMISVLRELKLNWTPGFHDALNGFSFLMFNPELLSPECFIPVQGNSFALKFRVVLVVPLVLIGLLLFFAACNSKMARIPLYRLLKTLSSCAGRAYKIPDANSQWRHQTKIYFAILRAFNTVLSFIYIIVASKSLSFFDCTKEADGRYYLDSEPSLRCYEDAWWQENLVLAWLGVSIYVIGIPTYFFAIFYFFYQEKHTGPFFSRMKRICKEAISQNTYVKPEFQYLILVQIMLKFMIISIQQFFTRYGSLQVLLLLFICFTSYVFYHGYKPYTYKSLNYLEALSSMSSAAILAVGLLLFTDQFPSEEQKVWLTAALLIILLGFVTATVVAVLYEFTNVLKNIDKGFCGKSRNSPKKPLPQAPSSMQLIKGDA